MLECATTQLPPPALECAPRSPQRKHNCEKRRNCTCASFANIAAEIESMLVVIMVLLESGTEHCYHQNLCILCSFWVVGSMCSVMTCFSAGFVCSVSNGRCRP